MSRKRSAVPSYRLHSPSGNAITTIYGSDGKRKTVYLGKFNSIKSKQEYRRILATLEASPAAAAHLSASMPGTVQGVAIAELIAMFWEHAQTHYQNSDGTPGRELDDFSLSFKPLRHLYDDTPAAEFGPLALKTIRKVMIDEKLGRKTINQRIARIRSLFKWAASEQLLPIAIYEALKAVDALSKGRTTAKDGTPVKPVSDKVYLATLPHCSKPIAAMLKLLRLCGCRPGELCIMRPIDLDTSTNIWTYRPSTHKTAKLGRERVVYFGPQSQLVLKPYLADCPESEFVFSPMRERAKRYADLRKRRQSKVQPSQVDRSRPKAQRLPSERYDAQAIAHAVGKACDKGGIAHWFPYQLRHAFATEARKRYGAEAAQVLLGHANLNVTEIYAERDADKAREVVAMVG